MHAEAENDYPIIEWQFFDSVGRMVLLLDQFVG